ncbi:serine/threonine-protein kinase [Fortiea contorta]|uniref:serine/threonine-protein kinase n=1 Tax=Fortiea contorta TaxID=1892405 RepID=UPI000347B8A2|nr:serine/threonine-protein kinase [Fortiea contorta]
MSYCINPHCSQPQNSKQPLFCQACGSDLLLEGCYRVIRPLGGGGFGKTFEVDDCGKAKVLKVLFNTHPKAIELFQQEAEVLKLLNHPGIPKVDSDGYFTYLPRNSQEHLHCLVMEKIEGMNLAEYLIQRNNEPISQRAALRWLKQLTKVLHKVHQQQYFHRDIKPTNIMIRPNGNPVLIDFGTAREVTQTYMHKVAGQQVTGIISAGYTPQEQANGKAVPQSDFFALGRTFVYLLTGKSPHEFTEDPRTGELNWQSNTKDIAQEILDLIDYLMAPFPGNRPQDTQEILDKLKEIEQALNPQKNSSQIPIVNPQIYTPQPHPSPPVVTQNINLKDRISKFFLEESSGIRITASVILLLEIVLILHGLKWGSLGSLWGSGWIFVLFKANQGFWFVIFAYPAWFCLKAFLNGKWDWYE